MGAVGLRRLGARGVLHRPGELGPACARRLDTVSTVSGLFAVLAACLTVGAWLFPLRFWALMGGAVLSWLAAAGVLFFGGMLAQ
ncbi:hypothetical protein [Nonomuraea dietziae]|uniref:hypothetical protein n=1 Tax=Nonomuraea dietziae TaxID=65515 RepID=UPI0031D111F1